MMVSLGQDLQRLHTLAALPWQRSIAGGSSEWSKVAIPIKSPHTAFGRIFQIQVLQFHCALSNVFKMPPYFCKLLEGMARGWLKAQVCQELWPT
jgi:hypothetical protein